MNDTLHEKVVGKYRYRVLPDHHFQLSDIDDYFECESDITEYKQLFIDDKLFSYEVIKDEKCTCCDNYKQVDGTAGMHFESAEEALQDYLTNYNAEV